MAGPRPTAAAIADPLAAVAVLYAAAGRPGADGDWGVEAFFTALADDPELAAQAGGWVGGGAAGSGSSATNALYPRPPRPAPRPLRSPASTPATSTLCRCTVS